MEKQARKTPLLIATALMAVTTLVHLFAGGPELYGPLRASDYPAMPKSVFSVIWHFVSLQLALMTAALYHLYRSPNRALFGYVLASSFGFGLLFLAYGWADLGTIWQTPQWLAFFGVAALMLPRAARL